ncbi:serine hydrolase domain-containing protein [Brevundimonas aveniformis]|uniref:serine hydrolase domain-containing protein n=1 Tax=Brevundimonas aveniformis TaxID=370977 RepID=UPI000415AF61|nr:serine hydrolase [Brevundimonas aveniformis]
MGFLMDLTRRTMTVAGGAFAALGLGSRAQAQAMDGPFRDALTYSDERGGVSVLVQRGPEVLLEAYANGGGPERDWPIHSGTKSLSGVMACELVREGWLDLDAPVSDIITEWQADPAKATITTRGLLNLTSGLVAGGFGAPPTYDEAVAAGLQTAPGAHFEYNPGPFQVWGEMVRRMLADRGYLPDVLGFYRSRVIDPAAVQVADWRLHGGQPTLPTGVRLTAREWAKWGRWVLDGAGGADLTPCWTGSEANPGYGLCWWLLRPGLIAPAARSGMGDDGAEMAERGEDIRLAAGAGEQKLYLLPERDLLVVRQSRGFGTALAGFVPGWSDTEFMRRVLRGL